MTAVTGERMPAWAAMARDRKALRRMYLRMIGATFRAARAKWATIIATNYLGPMLEVSAIFMIYALIDSSARGRATSMIERGAVFAGIAPPGKPAVTYLLVIAAFIMIAGAVAARYLNQVLLGRLRIQMYVGHCQRLIDAFLHTNLRRAREVGKDRIISGVFNDCGALQASVELGITLLGAAWAISLCLIGAAALSWKLLIAGSVLYALPIFASRKIFVGMRALGEKRARSQERALSYLNDVLEGFERTKTDGLEGILSSTSNNMLQITQQWKVDKRIAEAKQLAILDGLSMAGVLAVLFCGVVLFNLDLSLMLALFLLFGRLRGNMTALTRAGLELRTLIAPIYRYFELMTALSQSRIDATEIDSRPGTIAPIVLSDVSFRYREAPILRGVSMHANAGDRILITGASGQGKSTLIEILCGLLPPDDGTLTVAGEPFDDEAFYRYRSVITLVTPSVYLFRGSLRDNLTMGRSVDDAQIFEAVRRARLDDIIDSVDGGLDGDIGINGDSLSLGQRQRVLLSRVFLDRPKLLLLDEATTNLNPSLEAEIVDRLQSFVDPDCIIVMVAHKAPANYRYNKRYEMRDGCLTEIGADTSAFATAGE